MKEQFVPYELALKLKELGFDEECFRNYTEDNRMLPGHANTSHYTPAPLWQQAILWGLKKVGEISLEFVSIKYYDDYSGHFKLHGKRYDFENLFEALEILIRSINEQTTKRS